jgi:hypothetical protein
LEQKNKTIVALPLPLALAVLFIAPLLVALYYQYALE